MRSIHDRGGWRLHRDCTNHHRSKNGVKLVPTSVKNSHTNVICERVHHMISNTLRTMILFNPPNDILDANKLIGSALATVANARHPSILESLSHER
jgi:hypothetical protein